MINSEMLPYALIIAAGFFILGYITRDGVK